MLNAKDVGALLLAYPTVGLSHCLVQDKQLELAHAVRYYTGLPSLQVAAGYNTPNADAPLRSLLDLNLRDSTVEDNVRKRPFFQIVFDPSKPLSAGGANACQHLWTN